MGSDRAEHYGSDQGAAESGAGGRHGPGDVARLRDDVAAVAAVLRPIAGDRLDEVWKGIDDLPDATVARALDAAQGIRQLADEPVQTGRDGGGRSGAGRSLAGLLAAFALGLFAGTFVGRRTR